MHTILQAKKIEESREKLNCEIQKANECPLVRNVMKATQAEASSKEVNHRQCKTNNFFDTC